MANRDLIIILIPGIFAFIIGIINSIVLYVNKKKQIKHEEKLKQFENSEARKLHNYQNLSNDQKNIIKVLPRMLSNYYKSESGVLDVDENLRKALKDTGYKNQEIEKVQSPILFFNDLVLNTALSTEVFKLLSWNMEAVYNERYEKDKDLLIPYYSLLYKYLIRDLKQLKIDDDLLIKIIISDYKIGIYDSKFSLIKMENIL